MWYDKILILFKNKDLRNKFIFVLFIFVVFRIAANVPIPGIGTENLKRFFADNQVFGLLNIFSGGALSNFSIVLMGVGPYITATIILQLLTLIFAGIVASLPINIFQTFISWDASKIPAYILFFVSSLIIIAGVVLITEARRNIPVSYAKRVRGNKMYGGGSTYLPLNINPAGVMPIIFALSILLFPGMIAGFFGGMQGFVGTAANATAAFFNNQWVHGVLYFLLVIVFTYFYTAVTFDPKAISENLQKMGGFIPGVRPGESTAKFLKHILNRVLFTGAIFLGLIAVLPNIVSGVTGVTGFTFLIGGTSLLIIVSVVLDTMRQMNAQLEMREYDTF